MRSIKWTFLVAVFPVPLALLAAGLAWQAPALLAAAFVVQYAGLLAERWFFFAQANHPQNLYYQRDLVTQAVLRGVARRTSLLLY